MTPDRERPAASKIEWTPTKVGYVRAVVDGAGKLGTPNDSPGPLSDYWRRVLTDLLDAVESVVSDGR